MTTPCKLTTLLAAATMMAASSLHAADFKLKQSDVSQTNSFVNALNWVDYTDGTTAATTGPSTGNNYFVSGGFALRTPTNSGNLTFGGDSLTLGNGTTTGTLSIKSALGATITVNNLTLNNGEIANAGGGTGSGTSNGTFTLAGNGVTLTNGTTNRLNANASTRSLIVTAKISGGGGLDINGPGVVTLSGANDYTGGTKISAGTLTLSGSGTLGATTGALNLNGGKLDLGTTTQTVGAVTLGSGTIQNGTLTANGAVTVGAAGVTMAANTTLNLVGAVTLTSTTAAFTNTAGGTLHFGSNSLDATIFGSGYNGSPYTLISGASDANFTNITFDTNAWSSVTFSNGQLTFTAVPEPSTYGLIGAGALAAVAFVRRRRKHAVAA